jgi:hypothetical protein
LLQLERGEREHWRGRGGIQERDDVDDDDDDGSSIHGQKQKKKKVFLCLHDDDHICFAAQARFLKPR